MAVSGVAQVIAPEYVTFVVLIFVNAFGTAGVYPLAFILGTKTAWFTAEYSLLLIFQVWKWWEKTKGK